MKQLQISAKTLGELNLPDFCPRCVWIKLHCEGKVPFQIFPGIFNSIDSYTKNITRVHFRRHQRTPNWFASLELPGIPIEVPHSSTFKVNDSKTNICLTGAPDEILMGDQGFYIIDYKTAKYTEKQESLIPMYEGQLNAYAYIATAKPELGITPIQGLGLLYYEPLTDLSEDQIDLFTLENGFSMHFKATLHRVDLNPDLTPNLLMNARNLYEQPNPPQGNPKCKDCNFLEKLLEVATR